MSCVLFIQVIFWVILFVDRVRAKDEGSGMI